MLCLLMAASPAGAAPSGVLSEKRSEARELARQVAALDSQIGEAVSRYSRATRALQAVRRQLRENRRRQRVTYQQLHLARAALATRAVAMYKHADVGALDALLGAADISDLVTQLTMVRSIAQGDRTTVATIERTERELKSRAATLTADAHTAEKLVDTCRAEVATIRTSLNQRRAVLADVRSDIRRLAAAVTVPAAQDGESSVEPPASDGDGAGDDGSGPWWPLIQRAASGNGISARGLYRLMMIESGGNASIVSPGGFSGLFQFSPATWKGSWNPWRTASITNGAAQIRAAALAIARGYGPTWWGASYAWAFQGD